MFANVSGLRVVGGGSASDHAASSGSSNIANAPASISR